MILLVVRSTQVPNRVPVLPENNYLDPIPEQKSTCDSTTYKHQILLPSAETKKKQITAILSLPIDAFFCSTEHKATLIVTAHSLEAKATVNKWSMNFLPTGFENAGLNLTAKR